MTEYEIPFNRPSLTGKELDYLSDALMNFHISGDGKYSKKCHNWLEKFFNLPKALLTTSCTHALEMAAFLLDIKPGDEIIIPSFTFVSTVNAFVNRGAAPIFIDIRPDTLNLDEEKLDVLITDKTKAVVLVHYAGVACEMDTILDITSSHNIQFIEDNAHGLFGKYKGKYLGTFGALATQSFHETKNITCGEGGALFINKPEYIERAEIIREKGTNRSRFFRGQVDKYTWVDLGSSYLPSDMLAAFLFAQFEAFETIQEKRKKIWEYYYNNLSNWAQESGVRLPMVPETCEQPFHMFYILMPNLETRQALIDHLRANKILGVFHYLPLHLSEMGQRLGGTQGDCPVTENISDRLLRLPFYNSLEERDLDRVVNTVKDFRF
ncbi:MAG: dTDP-4-amino-4,6-dideoxygalactose transaminase [Anaerolineales bacterium]|jgi:dTDP-4-amino-4,6-dideoxygalactose transaminase